MAMPAHICMSGWRRGGEEESTAVEVSPPSTFLNNFASERTDSSSGAWESP